MYCPDPPLIVKPKLLAQLLALLIGIALAAETVRVDRAHPVAGLDADLSSLGSNLNDDTSGLVRADEAWLCARGLVDYLEDLEDLEVGMAVAGGFDLNEDALRTNGPGPRRPGKVCLVFLNGTRTGSSTVTAWITGCMTPDMLPISA